MSAIYKSMGTTKQAFFQWKSRQEAKGGLLLNVDHIVSQVRKDHPRMGVRKIWRKMDVKQIGRDAFERQAFARGYRLKAQRNFQRTTNSYGVTRFDNHLLGKRVTGLNQVWVSDITYYRMAERFYYLTFIMDLYSRKVIGQSVSMTLCSDQTTIPALRQAIYRRKNRTNTIIHSDGGGQYYDKVFLKLTAQHKLINSMCYSSYENPHAERLMGILKNDYIYPYGPKTFDQLIRQTRRACRNYNEREHSSLGKLSPNTFEKQIKMKEK